MNYWPMKPKISNKLKSFVAKRATYQCEYCRLPEKDTLIRFHLEHIVSLKHGGSEIPDNLAYACPDCNFYKGTDLGTYLDNSEVFTRLFNPRKDNWDDHFELIEGLIQAKTPIAEATIRILQMNKPERIEIRKMIFL